MRRALVICAVAATAVLGGSPAGAAVSERNRFSGTETFTDAPCGTPLDVVSTFAGHEVMRTTRGGEAFRVRTTYSFETVFTNPETGKWLVIHGHGTFNEVRARQVEGDVYEFVQHEAGQPFILEDSDGNVIARDAGLIEYTVVFDTLGDGEPGGEQIGDAEILLRGPHPGFDEDFPFCEILEEELS